MTTKLREKARPSKHSTPPGSPEKRLWFAVITRALTDLLTISEKVEAKPHLKNVYKRDFVQIYHWFIKPEEDKLSFKWWLYGASNSLDDFNYNYENILEVVMIKKLSIYPDA